jgi:hypothetical protein
MDNLFKTYFYHKQQSKIYIIFYHIKRVRQGVYKDMERRQALLETKEQDEEQEKRKIKNIQMLKEQDNLKNMLSEKK